MLAKEIGIFLFFNTAICCEESRIISGRKITEFDVKSKLPLNVCNFKNMFKLLLICDAIL
jgi:hypothetical protein